jgi:hypothetical protein
MLLQRHHALAEPDNVFTSNHEFLLQRRAAFVDAD